MSSIFHAFRGFKGELSEKFKKKKENAHAEVWGDCWCDTIEILPPEETLSVEEEFKLGVELAIELYDGESTKLQSTRNQNEVPHYPLTHAVERYFKKEHPEFISNLCKDLKDGGKSKDDILKNVTEKIPDFVYEALQPLYTKIKKAKGEKQARNEMRNLIIFQLIGKQARAHFKEQMGENQRGLRT